ncbi:MAG: peroxidase family protein, partial [Cyanobacteria bacterium J06635_11]
PEGFGFSDTAFRVFILMASRRLKSDRFFTADYRAEIYTQFGLGWIDNNSFLTVLRRHYPALSPALYGLQNGFQPWRKLG